MKIASIAEVKAKFSAYLKESKEGAVVVTKNGRPVIVLLPVEDEEELERMIMAYSPRFNKILATARQGILETGVIRHEDFWDQIDKEVSGKGRKRGSHREKH